MIDNRIVCLLYRLLDIDPVLIVDATIDSPKTASFIAGKAPEETADQAEIAKAVAYLAGQSPRSYTHELVVTPAGDRWLP